MRVGFLQREVCPLCQTSGQSQELPHQSRSQPLSDLAFDESPLAPFLEQFYGGRLKPDNLCDGRYRIRRCGQCEFIYQDMILDDNGMQLLYQDWVDQAGSLKKKQNASCERLRQYAGQVNTLSKLFDKAPQATRVLDYGMGWGYWCRMAQAHGFDVMGYELSASRRKHALELGVPVIDSLPEDGLKFDFIFANQVFEHLPDPVQTLRELCCCLHAEGILYLRVPDGRDVAERLQQRGWSAELDAIHPLEHINCFTRKTLIRLAATQGLQPIKMPLQLEWGSLRRGIRREISDRWFSTHLMFRR
jgi:2-polyprenyl-3-methyl-5-hydroxy-6-metoxy-1,4-benzoquinol methylase